MKDVAGANWKEIMFVIEIRKVEIPKGLSAEGRTHMN
jgi:hypothetical protein